MGDGDMDMGGKCSMNMLWNTQIIDTCIVFPQWHIRSTAGFVLSFFAIVALGVFYEWVRATQKAVDRRIAQSLVITGKGKTSLRGGGIASVEGSPERAGLLTGHTTLRPQDVSIPVPARVVRSLLYGFNVFLSFFLMLVFMTYNAYLILAVVLGAAIGHFVLGSSMDVDAVLNGSGDKGMACH